MVERSLSRTKNELSEFVTLHRRKLTPAEVGLPTRGRRRTPGLRREEVAALAGVGLAWYTWFEQGRDIQVSEKFLLRVACALKLDDAECSHLFLLAHKRPPPPDARQGVSVSPLVQRLMDDLGRPAYVMNLHWDVVAWNAAADELFGFTTRERALRNILRIMFADPGMRRRLPAWHDDAPKLLAQFRYDFAVALDDPPLLALVEDLKNLSVDFRSLWEKPDSEGVQRGITSVTIETERQDFQHQTLVVDEHRHLRMVVYFVRQAASCLPANVAP